MDLRKNIYDLTDEELSNFKQALNNMKASGKYDEFIVRHHMAMSSPTLSPVETGTARNAAHRGPSFLPWHRAFLREFEVALQAALPGKDVTLPYWDWAADAQAGKNAAIWNTDPSKGRIYIGGDGTVGNPFPQWKALVENPLSPGSFMQRPGGIIRELGVRTQTLPTQSTVDSALAMNVYDVSPWSESQSTNPSFRNRLEGFLNLLGDEQGVQNHNRVHVWVGGDMLPGTSPNDPVFFLHHCFIDFLWARWQVSHPSTYAPLSGGPPSHNLNDPMMFVNGITAAQALDYSATFNYTYDSITPIVTDLNFIEVFVSFTHFLPAVFEVQSLQPIILAVQPANFPSLPFGVTVLNPVTIPPTNGQKTKVLFWFTFHPVDDSPVSQQTVSLDVILTGSTTPLASIPINLNATAISIPYIANVLVLDQSGSMSLPAGDLGLTRIEALRQAAGAFTALAPQDNAIGIASFSTGAQPVADVAPLGDGGGSDTVRENLQTAIASFNNIPLGKTAIGKGITVGKQMLDDINFLTPVNTPYTKSLVVFTDGVENVLPLIATIIGDINYNTYAVGLGNAQQVSTEALTTLTTSVGGYTLLTGDLSNVETENFFLLTKYFLQILSDLKQAGTAVDPAGFILPNQTVRIPFKLSEADFNSEVVLLTELPVVSLEIETPGGEIIPHNSPGVSFGSGPNLRFCRMSLPVPLSQGSAHIGTWHAVLKLTPDFHEKYRNAFERDPRRQRQLASLGTRYSLSVYTTSNLRLKAQVNQRGFLPGDSINLRAVLTEYGIPVEARAAVKAEVQRPDGTLATVSLKETEAGIFEADVKATINGVYRIRLLVTGKTLYGQPFTRERLMTGAVWQGSDRPLPSIESEDARRCYTVCRRLWLFLLLWFLLMLVLLLVFWLIMR